MLMQLNSYSDSERTHTTSRYLFYGSLSVMDPPPSKQSTLEIYLGENSQTLQNYSSQSSLREGTFAFKKN